MKLITPDYYKDFACIADRCRHSCCIGWEIDIDGDTLEFYDSVPGEFGERLRCGISREDTPCFKLDDGERCVFLNDRGLCDIILNMGEDALCDICTEHPRFRNYFADRTEVGLGLCCEEACRLILGQREPMKLTVAEDDGTDQPDPEEELFFAERQRVLDILQDRALPMTERLALLGVTSDDTTPKEWAEFYRGLERLDPAWDECLGLLGGCDSFAEPDDDPVWENLAVYVVYRHAADQSVPSSVAFAIHTVRLICTVCAAADADFDKLCDLCRMWSSEIEYSEENTAAIVEKLTE